MQLQDAREDSQTNIRIMELGQQAQYIQHSTGKRPENWYEFKVKNAAEFKPQKLRKGLIGAVVGLALGAALIGLAVAIAGTALPAAMVAPAITATIGAGLIGALIGTQTEVARENIHNKKLTDNYSTYLNTFEQAHAHQQSPSVNYRDDHAKRLQAEASVEQARSR